MRNVRARSRSAVLSSFAVVDGGLTDSSPCEGAGEQIFLSSSGMGRFKRIKRWLDKLMAPISCLSHHTTAAVAYCYVLVIQSSLLVKSRLPNFWHRVAPSAVQNSYSLRVNLHYTSVRIWDLLYLVWCCVSPKLVIYEISGWTRPYLTRGSHSWPSRARSLSVERGAFNNQFKLSCSKTHTLKTSNLMTHHMCCEGPLDILTSGKHPRGTW